MGKIRKSIIKKAAKIYAANILLNAMGCGAMSDLISEDELAYMQEEIERIAFRVFDGVEAHTIDDAIQMAITIKSI